ncbi:MAG TPA: hypothetical protein VKR83_17865 [Ktedonobacteraceae bacterium]|nr:hypothetical protein [Ktedonobacteraceae bacterium]
MIDCLYDVLPYLEHLPPEAQEEAASYIEALVEAFEREDFVPGGIQYIPREIQPVERWEDPAGAWHDLPDTILEDLDQLRHASPPSLPPLEYL